MLVSLCFLIIFLVTFVFIAKYKFRKDFRNTKMILYLSICFNFIFVSLVTVVSLYSGKFLRYFGWSSVILLFSMMVLLLPSLYKLKQHRIINLFINDYKNKNV